MLEIAAVLLDLANYAFLAHGADLSGPAVPRTKLRRDRVLAVMNVEEITRRGGSPANLA